MKKHLRKIDNLTQTEVEVILRYDFSCTPAPKTLGDVIKFADYLVKYSTLHNFDSNFFIKNFVNFAKRHKIKDLTIMSSPLDKNMICYEILKGELEWEEALHLYTFGIKTSSLPNGDTVYEYYKYVKNVNDVNLGSTHVQTAKPTEYELLEQIAKNTAETNRLLAILVGNTTSILNSKEDKTPIKPEKPTRECIKPMHIDFDNKKPIARKGNITNLDIKKDN